MATERLSMRHTREILRQKLTLGRSHRAIAQSLGLSSGTVGATVDKGTPLLVMEAMKMEHTLTAPARGTVKAFRYAPGDQVADGVELVDFEVMS